MLGMLTYDIKAPARKTLLFIVNFNKSINDLPYINLY